MHDTPRTADLTPPSGSRPDGTGGPSRLLRAVTVPLMLLVGAVLFLFLPTLLAKAKQFQSARAASEGAA